MRRRRCCAPVYAKRSTISAVFLSAPLRQRLVVCHQPPHVWLGRASLGQRDEGADRDLSLQPRRRRPHRVQNKREGRGFNGTSKTASSCRWPRRGKPLRWNPTLPMRMQRWTNEVAMRGFTRRLKRSQQYGYPRIVVITSTGIDVPTCGPDASLCRSRACIITNGLQRDAQVVRLNQPSVRITLLSTQSSSSIAGR